MNHTDFKNNFIERYESEIFPHFKEFEVLRKRTIKRYFTRVLIMFIITGAVYLISKILSNYYLEILVYAKHFTIAFPPIFIIWDYYDNHRNFISFLKTNCSPKLKYLFPDISWKQISSISSSNNYNLLFPYYNKRKNDDSLIIKQNNIECKLIETKLYYTFMDDIDAKIFQGLLIALKTQKETEKPLMVCSKGILTSRNNLISLFIAPTLSALPFFGYLTWLFSEANWFSDMPLFNILYLLFLFIIYNIFFASAAEKYKKNRGTKINKISLEDVKFNNKYDIFSDDEIKSRFILTPAFMEKLTNLKIIFKAKNIRCFFQGKEVIVALKTNKNLFEMGNLTKNFKNPNIFLSFYEEMSTVVEFAEYLNEKL